MWSCLPGDGRYMVTVAGQGCCPSTVERFKTEGAARMRAVELVRLLAQRGCTLLGALDGGYLMKGSSGRVEVKVRELVTC